MKSTSRGRCSKPARLWGATILDRTMPLKLTVAYLPNLLCAAEQNDAVNLGGGLQPFVEDPTVD